MYTQALQQIYVATDTDWYWLILSDTEFHIYSVFTLSWNNYSTETKN